MTPAPHAVRVTETRLRGGGGEFGGHIARRVAEPPGTIVHMVVSREAPQGRVCNMVRHINSPGHRGDKVVLQLAGSIEVPVDAEPLFDLAVVNNLQPLCVEQVLVHGVGGQVRLVVAVSGDGRGDR